MRKVIRIFLASSIRELTREREQLENFIRHISDQLEDSYDIKLQPLLCENFDHAYTLARSQEKYNEAIRGCDLCYFIFYTRLGEYTLEEFRVATEQFAAAGKPRIYVMFKEAAEPEPKLAQFRDQILSAQYEHFYDTFHHIDTLKLRLLTSLQLQELGFVKLEAEDGFCTMDGKAVLRLDDVMEFANNRQLPRLQQALQAAEEEYLLFKTRYCQGEPVQSQLSRAADRRKELRKQIAQLQEDIFSVSVRMVDDGIHGRISQRQQSAYRLFKQGDYESCMAILDPQDMDEDYSEQLQRNRRQLMALHRNYIREYYTRIELLRLMPGDPDRFRKLASCYEKIAPIALREKIELEIVHEYAQFLMLHHKDATSLLEQLRAACVESEEYDEGFFGRVLNSIAMAYDAQGMPQQAGDVYQQTIGLFTLLSQEDPERYRPELALSFNNAGVFFSNHGQPEQAIDLHQKAIYILEQLPQDSPYWRSVLSMSYENLAILRFQHRGRDQVEAYFLKALDILEVLAKQDPDTYLPGLAKCYNNLGHFYQEQTQFERSEHYYTLSLNIRQQLERSDPEQFTPDAAKAYIDLALLMKMMPDREEQADGYYEKALQLWEGLYRSDPRPYREAYARCCLNVGLHYMSKQQDAREYLQTATDIARELAQEDPMKYTAMFAHFSDTLGVAHRRFGRLDLALECHRTAIGYLQVLLDGGNQSVCPQLSRCHNNAAIACEESGDRSQAEEHYRQAIQVLSDLQETDPAACIPVLAVAYLNYAICLQSQELFDQALQTAWQMPGHPDCRRIIRMLQNI